MPAKIKLTIGIRILENLASSAFWKYRNSGGYAQINITGKIEINHVLRAVADFSFSTVIILCFLSYKHATIIYHCILQISTLIISNPHYFTLNSFEEVISTPKPATVELTFANLRKRRRWKLLLSTPGYF